MVKRVVGFCLFLFLFGSVFLFASGFTEGLKGAGSDTLIQSAANSIKDQDYEASLLHLANAEDLEPNRALIFGIRAEVFLKQNKFKEAVVQAERAIALGADSAAMQLTYAKSLASSGDFEKASQALKKAKALGEESADFYLVSGFVHTGKGQAPEALAAYRVAVEKNPALKSAVQDLVKMNGEMFLPHLKS